jgi:hypothetical protein
MKHITKIAGLLLMAGVAFVAGAFTVIVNRPHVDIVTVEIRNQSKQDIKEIELIEAHGTTLKIPGLPSQQTIRTGFYYPGETGYSLRVVFKDNTELKGGGQYVEPGYSVIETIKQKEIKSEYRSLYSP